MRSSPYPSCGVDVDDVDPLLPEEPRRAPPGRSSRIRPCSRSSRTRAKVRRVHQVETAHAAQVLSVPDLGAPDDAGRRGRCESHPRLRVHHSAPAERPARAPVPNSSGCSRPLAPCASHAHPMIATAAGGGLPPPRRPQTGAGLHHPLPTLLSLPAPQTWAVLPSISRAVVRHRRTLTVTPGVSYGRTRRQKPTLPNRGGQSNNQPHALGVDSRSTCANARLLVSMCRFSPSARPAVPEAWAWSNDHRPRRNSARAACLRAFDRQRGLQTMTSAAPAADARAASGPFKPWDAIAHQQHPPQPESAFADRSPPACATQVGSAALRRRWSLPRPRLSPPPARLRHILNWAWRSSAVRCQGVVDDVANGLQIIRACMSRRLPRRGPGVFQQRLHPPAKRHRVATGHPAELSGSSTRRSAAREYGLRREFHEPRVWYTTASRLSTTRSAALCEPQRPVRVVPQ